MNQRSDNIIPECYIDTNLVETLVCHAGCNHQKGCNQVVKVMQEKFADRFAVGIIDADKRQPSYINEFQEVVSSEHLKLYRHKSRFHFIILVYPAADGFILHCTQEANVDMAEYGLSPVLKEFTSETKNVMSNKDIRFKRLFKSIENAHEMRILKALLSHLADKTYYASDDEIKSIFITVGNTRAGADAANA